MQQCHGDIQHSFIREHGLTVCKGEQIIWKQQQDPRTRCPSCLLSPVAWRHGRASSFLFMAVKEALSSGAWHMGVKASGWRISPFKQLKELAPKRPIEKAEWFCYGDT